MTEKTNHTKVLLWISIPFFILLILISALQWYKLNENISKTKAENRKNYERLFKANTNGYFQIEVKKFDNKNVIIDKDEVNKINNHIDALTQEVKKESNRAESIIDKDLDRLNLYMAVGIGFMTLLGVFVPIFINFLSVQDLRDQQNQISKDFGELKSKQPDIKKAIDDSKTAISQASLAIDKTQQLDGLTEKITSIELRTKKAIPDICNLMLQNSIGRFFNMGPMILSKGSRKKNYKEFILLLAVIKNGFEQCNNDSDHTVATPHFRNTLDDFIISLETEKFQLHPAFNERNDYKVFQDLIQNLIELRESPEEEEEKKYKNVIDKIVEIITIFQSKNAQN